MDRGQIFIGKKLYGLRSIEDLDREIVKYGHRYDSEKAHAVRIDGKETKYDVHYNDQTDFPQEGIIFGLEAIASYINFTEYTEQCKAVIREEPKQLPSGSDRDWIQEFDLEKLSQILREVKKDIPDAQVMIMDLHY